MHSHGRSGGAGPLLSRLALITMLGISVAAAAPGTDGSGSWDVGFNRQGCSAPVRYLLGTNGNLVISARGMDALGDQPLLHMALWDGRAARGMGDLQLGHMVEYAGQVIATRDGGSPFQPSSVMAWDGAAWTEIGVTDSPVSTLGIYQGEVVAAGSFSTIGGVEANGVATWNGSRWAPLGSGIRGDLVLLGVNLVLPGGIAAAVEYDGNLLLAGRFAADISTSGVARWDGQTWSLTPVAGGSPLAAAVWDDKLVIGGTFTSIDGVPARRLAAYEGGAWSEMGGGADGRVRALVEHDGRLIVGGQFHEVGGILGAGPGPIGIAGWNGLSWSALASGVDSPIHDPEVTALAAFDGDLYAGGSFEQIDGLVADHIARWDGVSWSPVARPGNGTYGGVSDATEWGGRLVVVGPDAYFAGQNPISHVAAWDGTSWTALGGLLEDIWVATEYGSKLVVAGGMPGDLENVLHLWDGDEWSAIGGPLTGRTGRSASTVTALLSHDNRLYVGGAFTVADGIPARHVVLWDGADFHPLGEGLAGGEEFVRALAEYKGEIVAAGSFTSAGGTPAANIAAWDGEHWHPLGEGLTGSLPGALPGLVVQDLAVYRGELVVVGVFAMAGGQPSQGIARWDGAEWHGMGGSDGFATGACVFDGELIVSGFFSAVGGVEARRLAAWDGKTWRAIGGGVDAPAYWLLPWRGSLFLDSLGRVGTEVISSGIARWSPHGKMP